MKTFTSLFKKELLESVRSGKLFLIIVIFGFCGAMNPLIAKFTPLLIKALSESLAESGMTVTNVNVDALTSWTQFYKNIPMAFIAFILLYGGIFTTEYTSGTLVLLFTKGIKRYKVVLSKMLTLVFMWTLGYSICTAITVVSGYILWSNTVVYNLAPAILYGYIFGLFVIALTVFFSVTVKHYALVLLGVGGVCLLMSALATLPKISRYLPISLFNGMGILSGAEKPEKYLICAIISLLLSVFLIVISVFQMNKKEI